MKKILAIVLTICMLAALGITAHAEAADYPWASLDISRIVFADGTTSIAADPFSGMTGIVEVVLPASVMKVESDAFADSAVASVVTAGDSHVVSGVVAFAAAEVSEVSPADFAAIAEEIEAAATTREDTFSYDASSKSLLVKGIVPKAPANFIPYVVSSDDSSDSTLNDSTPTKMPYYAPDGTLIGTCLVDRDGKIISADYTVNGRNYHADFSYGEDGILDTIKEAWSDSSGGTGTSISTCDGSGNSRH